MKSVKVLKYPIDPLSYTLKITLLTYILFRLRRDFLLILIALFLITNRIINTEYLYIFLLNSAIEHFHQSKIKDIR